MQRKKDVREQRMGIRHVAMLLLLGITGGPATAQDLIVEGTVSAQGNVTAPNVGFQSFSRVVSSVFNAPPGVWTSGVVDTCPAGAKLVFWGVEAVNFPTGGSFDGTYNYCHAVPVGDGVAAQYFGTIQNPNFGCTVSGLCVAD